MRAQRPLLTGRALWEAGSKRKHRGVPAGKAGPYQRGRRVFLLGLPAPGTLLTPPSRPLCGAGSSLLYHILKHGFFSLWPFHILIFGIVFQLFSIDWLSPGPINISSVSGLPHAGSKGHSSTLRTVTDKPTVCGKQILGRKLM